LRKTPTFTCPVVSGNRLFTRDRDSLALLTLEQPGENPAN
jgi:hypothetical protein